MRENLKKIKFFVIFAFVYKKNKYFSSISSRGCGFVEKREKFRKDKEADVDKLWGVMPSLSTVCTDERWMGDYPQNIHMK